MVEVDRRTVLIVDDDDDLRLLVRLLLTGADHDIEVVGEAPDGDTAVQIWEALDPPNVPDVVILDNQMPGRLGIDVAERMLSQHADQRIVIFTANLTSTLRERARRVGVRACLNKRDSAVLPSLISELLRPA